MTERNGMCFCGGGYPHHHDHAEADKVAALELQVSEITKERESLKDILILEGRKLDAANRLNEELQKVLRSAAERWCWCKQEDLPGDCARCIASVALIEKR